MYGQLLENGIFANWKLTRQRWDGKEGEPKLRELGF
jgi:hypothetical protein